MEATTHRRLRLRGKNGVAGAVIVAVLIAILAGLVLTQLGHTRGRRIGPSASGLSATAGSPGARDHSEAAVPLRAALAGSLAMDTYHVRVLVTLAYSSDLDVQKGKGATGIVTDAKAQFSLIAAGGKEYASGGAYAKLLRDAGKPETGWVELPAQQFASGSYYGAGYDFYQPITCLLATHGTLSTGHRVSINGVQAQEIIDAGDKPASTPASFFVAVDGPPRVLRLAVFGPRQPGQVSSACTDILGGSSPGTPSPVRAASALITFDFTSPGKAVAVGAPPGSLTQVALGNYLANVQATPVGDIP